MGEVRTATTRTVKGKVIDQDGDVAEYSASVTVKSPTRGTTDLRTAIGTALLAPDIRNALPANLDAVLKAIASGKIKTACAALSDFINQVKAQRGKAISAATADQWILEAMRLRRRWAADLNGNAVRGTAGAAFTVSGLPICLFRLPILRCFGRPSAKCAPMRRLCAPPRGKCIACLSY